MTITQAVQVPEFWYGLCAIVLITTFVFMVVAEVVDRLRGH